MALTQNTDNLPKRELDLKLDLLEAKLADLKIAYEQFFLDILPHPPNELEREVHRLVRECRNAPFKKATSTFRLGQIVQRLQTYNNYWERVKRDREAGTYSRDVFKASLRADSRKKKKAHQ